MCHPVPPPLCVAERSPIPQSDLLREFSLRVKCYARRTGYYPLAEPWYTGHRIKILSSQTVTPVQMDAFEDDLFARIQEHTSLLCAGI